jgi:hypothetical protein
MKTKFKTLGQIQTILGILSLVLLAQTMLAETWFTNEVWISPVIQTNGGNGTLDYPYDGSTQAKFDAVMGNLLPNTTIHLLAGTYMTSGNNSVGGYQLKSGQKVLGSGIDVTIIQLVPRTVRGGDGTYVLASYSYAACSNIEVCDLTCDCNYTSGTSETYHGVVLCGTQNAIRRVKVIHQASFGGHPEAFGIELANCYLPDSTGNIIEECEVSQYKGAETGGTISAITICQGSGIMRNNRVYLSPSSGGAFNNSWTHDLLIEGNYVDGASCGVYGDTGGSTNMIIVHNTFKNCGLGVNFQNNTTDPSGFVRQNITIAFNNIILADGNSFGILLNNSGPPGCDTNFMIIGNTFSLKDQGTGTAYAFNIQNVSGLVCANNRIDASMTNYFSGCTGVNIYNNYDLIGNFLTNLNQLASPNGVTRRAVTYSGPKGPYTYANYADTYIGVNSFSHYNSGAAVVVLPSAVGHAGKNFIIADESGQLSSNIRYIVIQTTSPNIINGGSSITIATPYAAMSLISDGTNWFAH